MSVTTCPSMVDSEQELPEPQEHVASTGFCCFNGRRLARKLTRATIPCLPNSSSTRCGGSIGNEGLTNACPRGHSSGASCQFQCSVINSVTEHWRRVCRNTTRSALAAQAPPFVAPIQSDGRIETRKRSITSPPARNSGKQIVTCLGVAAVLTLSVQPGCHRALSQFSPEQADDPTFFVQINHVDLLHFPLALPCPRSGGRLAAGRRGQG